MRNPARLQSTPVNASASHRRARRAEPGFTLLELMMVLVVVGILATIALPSYIERMERDQVAQALSLADVAKPAIQAAWLLGEPLPADNAAAHLPAAEKIVNERVRSVTVSNGAIHITFGNQASKALQGQVLTVRPAGVPDARVVPLVWLCGRAGPPAPMQAQGEDRTSVPAGLLPPRCR
ncbi:pilin [Ramlibacter ginsenosidimutans]|uniref:Pilin n=1 Tax=Ramlibacter ginsenosidimutans TaxID=502333 RepID=A0A934U0Z0_9BURK|nr:pilin [Ramlibacter ginsenosidimutans]